ncbi:MAG: D-aminoacyl-tRNA deacylase [Candidatus Bathyarchaeia archaeon]
MILIVASTKDIAGMNIAHQILEHYGFEKLPEAFRELPVYSTGVQNQEVRLVFVDVEPVYTQFITDFFTPELLVFISRHSSLSGIPTLSAHTPGNLGRAELGGVPRKVSISPASAMRDALLEMAKLKEEMRLNYQVSYECTHHGPSLDVPTMFVELGSSPKQWKDLRAAEVVAHAAMAAVSKRSRYPAALGIGGPHYNKEFTKIALGTQTAFGHMIPKYAIPQVDAEMVEQCVERTMETVESAFLDWKGIRGADKGRLTAILGEIGVPIEKV